MHLRRVLAAAVVAGAVLTPPAPGAASSDSPPRIINQITRALAPGVHYRQWDQLDGRGTIRVHLLDIDPSTPGVSIDYVAGPRVSTTATVQEMVADDPATVGAINGDFYDIGRTGAPLGVGVDRQLALLHAPRSGWNQSFVIDHGVAKVGFYPLQARVSGHPELKVTNFNSPLIAPNGIGLYDRHWGPPPGAVVVEQDLRVRRVVIRHGRVRSNKEGLLARGRSIQGKLLIGRGEAADLLAGLKTGATLRVTAALKSRPEVAISGSQLLLRDGELRTHEDVDLHPRTAIGIDQDNGHILMFVVDGRRRWSRGVSLLELATLLRGIGVEDALNLDGGGSSTMLGLKQRELHVLNKPSDGFERRVADGLAVTFTSPVSAPPPAPPK